MMALLNKRKNLKLNLLYNRNHVKDEHGQDPETVTSNFKMTVERSKRNSFLTLIFMANLF